MRRALASRGCWALFLVPIGFFLAVETVLEWHNFQMLSASGTTTQATVFDRSISTDTRYGDKYYLKYRFTTNDRTYEGSDLVSHSTFEEDDPGTQVTIQYAQADPTISHLGTDDSPGSAIFLTIVVVCWTALSILIMLGGINTLARMRRSI